MVFYYIPWFGSAAYYGQDPYKFFFECRDKVRSRPLGRFDLYRSLNTHNGALLTISTETYSRSR